MRSKITIYIIAFAIFAALSAAILVWPQKRIELPREAVLAEPHIPTAEMFYSEANFIEAQAAVSSAPEHGVRALILPHHLLASRFIADGVARASGNLYDTVVVVGPNHDDRGPDIVTSSAVAYETPYGFVYSDEEKVKEVRQLFSDYGDYTDFLPEHSVGAIIPFVAEKFPGVKVVPVIISSQAKGAEAKRLAEWLAGLGHKTLVIFSIDFSHYLTQAEAAKNDAETESALKAMDTATISRWGNEHIDSPVTALTALNFAAFIGGKIQIIDHANANDFLPVPAQSTTSYFEVMIKE